MSDHFSGPAVLGDPAVDITDFYAFASPERPGNLVLIMDVFPMATSQSYFSDVVNHRFRLRPLTRSAGSVTCGAAEETIDIRFSDVPEETAVQKGHIVTSNGREASFVVGKPFEQDGLRVFAGLVSDPFFMDVEATLRTDISGKLSFNTATNTVQFRDVLSIVVEVPFAPIVERFDGVTLTAAISEIVVTRRGKPIRLERLGRPEIKNVVIANSARDPRTRGVELRDLYNREDAFALSREYRSLYESRLDANLAFWDGLDSKTAWPSEPDGRHPLRDLLMDDFLILDLGQAFAPGSFLEIERALIDNRPHASAGGRWLDDDILDELLTLLANGGRGERLGDGVDAPTKPASRTFPYVREPNRRADLPLPEFLRS
ncbi:DUF4331 domain-containing protein [Mesorhizobium onobrychidis]|uniref:DUF4331 family protein n=1 Tax=Mesorhizobium onobrychidis TaxID=2775404 RepID=A0ABY5R501_9HYPH|nr:DUF4331 domain-containing protein [Mesorhizobium onobrychidis]UVC17904.1 DUF4331 family protein [Mesorhizobium onobrychidis]